MTQSDLHLEQSETDVNEQKGVSRRRLLKLLGASGLAVGAAALLPAKWISPQAEVSAQANNGPWPGGCTVEDFPLTIGGSTVSLVNAATGVWKVDFQYFDSAGLLSNSSLLTAGVVNTREPLYRKAQLGTSPNGGVFLLSNASYSPACNTSATVGQTGGEGYFHFSY
ncbi:MAG: twin-arginine translocation signal domain-containing protein, partial [Candidatus Promineifilaceae bacterium]